MQYYEFKHHEDLRAFYKAKEDGCHLCYLLWKEMLKEWGLQLGDSNTKKFFKKDFRVTWTATHDRGDMTLTFYAHFDKANKKFFDEGLQLSHSSEGKKYCNKQNTKLT